MSSFPGADGFAGAVPHDKRGLVSDLASPVAVLCSGGLDSSVLLVEMARTTGRAVPLFVRAGHVWESAERSALVRFLAAVGEERIARLRDLAVPMHDVYDADWSMTGKHPPVWTAPDESVELQGRNLVLLVKALVLAAKEGWPTVALGSLAGNPFPDATPRFVEKISEAASEGLGTRLTVVQPYRRLDKKDVVRRGATLPLHLTLSCLHPTENGLHCGNCCKCRERSEAFFRAGSRDQTRYAQPLPQP
jgi:7-cyano-7-deazaguanine synthase